MPQVHRISKNNTRQTVHADSSKSVTLHHTEIIRHWPALRKVRLYTGGYYTSTTRNRMNQAFSEWGIPLAVSFARGTYNEVRNHVTGATVRFADAKTPHTLEITY